MKKKLYILGSYVAMVLIFLPVIALNAQAPPPPPPPPPSFIAPDGSDTNNFSGSGVSVPSPSPTSPTPPVQAPPTSFPIGGGIDETLVSTDPTPTSRGLEKYSRAGTVYEFITQVLGVVVQIGVPIAVFFIIYGGFLFVTAGGSEEKIKTAKNTLVWALIGSGVLLGAWVIALAVESTLKQLGVGLI